jgi:enoyl-CoA hydratase/carnithine racemase
MNETPILIQERKGTTLVLTLNRARKRNAVNEELFASLRQAIETIPDDVRAVVIAAAGDHFCAGLDLVEQKDRTPVQVLEHSRLWHAVFDRLQQGPRPVIAALHGAVIGGGFEIAATAHIRVADSTAFFQLPEARRGIYVGGGGSVRIARIIGSHRMAEMMLTGRVVDVERAERLGVVDYLVDAGGALAKAMELAETVAANAPLVNYLTLQALSRISAMSPEQGLFTESLAAALSQTSGDARAGIEAFLDRRTAVFGSEK